MVSFVFLCTRVAVLGLDEVTLRAGRRPIMVDDQSYVSSRLCTVFRSHTDRYLHTVVDHMRRFLKPLYY